MPCVWLDSIGSVGWGRRQGLNCEHIPSCLHPTCAACSSSEPGGKKEGAMQPLLWAGVEGPRLKRQANSCLWGALGLSRDLNLIQFFTK